MQGKTELIIILLNNEFGGPEGFKQLEDLAKILKGALGASRPPCDNGWGNKTRGIRFINKIIAPELHVAIGISDSIQHISGCSGSKTIVTINKDTESNIFREARFGVVGDWKKVLTTFTQKVKKPCKGWSFYACLLANAIIAWVIPSKS